MPTLFRCNRDVEVDVNAYYNPSLAPNAAAVKTVVSNNITAYAFLLHIIANLTGYIPRKLVHIIGDAHIYSQHISAVNKQLMRTPNRFPKLKINKLTDIDDIDENSFKIMNYDHYNTIPASMIA